MRISLQTATDRIRSDGALVAIPTDTVYGVAARIGDDKALHSLYRLKKRPSSKPVCILISDFARAFDLATSFSPKMQALAHVFWPGPLTLILPANEKRVSPLLRSHLPTVGIRVPGCSVARELIQEVGPLAVTSANLSDGSPALFPEEVEKIFGEDFPILEGEAPITGTPSTIISEKDSEIEILREGEISRKTIALFD